MQVGKPRLGGEGPGEGHVGLRGLPGSSGSVYCWTQPSEGSWEKVLLSILQVGQSRLRELRPRLKPHSLSGQARPPGGLILGAGWFCCQAWVPALTGLRLEMEVEGPPPLSAPPHCQPLSDGGALS